ncbi:MAG TPA: chromosome segregation protein SMC [Burkholderiales bacterium]|nr:chromosome segregation protein SMC [Burkholderiales bacterium]
MRLKQINLAGFKSFVEPTHIPVPGQLVGIVGPNGCGKSNVIDAVRWVLGETSARHLRGETMQDVLFNGSGQRQPVNRASVELVFDNSLGRAAGQWSSYAEIAIRRVLERDGESTAYYINNVHVRRRDVADIFLGTGLGARAYAIMEQGMISRVIEAKPEELRVFLEEAAGVSKYRERRRETELRLTDTRENLLRVDDIRQELDKQLEHLAAQAEVAGRYHELQGRLTTTQSLMWLLRRQEAAAQRARHGREIERLGVELEAETARLREAERQLEEMRTRHYRASDEVHAAQGAFYEANADTSRLEQEIAHCRDSRQRLEREIAELNAQLARDREQRAAAETGLAGWGEELVRAAEQLAARDAALQVEAGKLPLAEEACRAARNHHDELQRAGAETAQALQVEYANRAHARQLLDQLAQRAERLNEERGSLQAPDTAQRTLLTDGIAAAEAALREMRAELNAREDELPQSEQALRDRNAVLESATQRIAGMEARLHTLAQLQERLERGAGAEGWLTRQGLAGARRLWQDIRIEPGWEDALEAVLRERLNGIALPDLDQAQPWFEDAPPAKTAFYAPGQEPALQRGAYLGCEPLSSYLACQDPELAAIVAEWLQGVYVVRSAATGLAQRILLPAGMLLVTREGHVFTRHSVSFHAPDTELHGVLTRQREIEDLTALIDAARAESTGLRQAARSAEDDIEHRRAALDELRQRIDSEQQNQHSLQLEALRLSGESERIARRAGQIALDLAEIGGQTAEAGGRYEVSALAITRLEGELEHGRAQATLAADLYQRAENGLGLQRDTLQAARDAAHHAGFHHQSCSIKINEIESSVKVISEALERSNLALAARAAEHAGYDEEPLQERLQQALAVRKEREAALARLRDELEGMEAQLKATDQKRAECEANLEPLRERIGEVRLKEQEARLTEEQFARQLADAGAREEELAPMLEKGARANALQAEIARLADEIRELGAVNLAAVEELRTAQERKDYLDAQSGDLTEAIATLEDAIRRIDRETRERLQRTFDDVNEHFGRMFPVLFGGGHARLVLTGEEILDAGVQVIAQPPGKKNSTIHLLSGGEKALTALALVFALFQLNPAPFCLLDEVDAPLDDHNTERFCDLVKTMSAHSQFLFISHNKITMEIAEQLLGITMQEAGVSRVVAVDIEEAMKISEAA